MNLYIVLSLQLLALMEMAAAGVTIGGMNFFGNSNGGNNVNSPYYQINNQQYTRNGKCIRVFKVIGHGVDDSFEEPCSNQSPSTFLDTNFLIVGDPDKTQLCLFTDAHAKLVVIKNGKCNLRTYTTENGQTTKVESLMDDAICSEVKRKIAEEQEKNRIYWIEWQKKFDARMRKAFPPGFPFHKTNGQESSSSSSSSEENTNKAPYINLLNGVTHGAKPPTTNPPTNYNLMPQPLIPSTAINVSPPSSPILPSTGTMNSPTNFNLMPQPLTPSTAINVSPPSSPILPSNGISSNTLNDQNTGYQNSASTSKFSFETSFPSTNKKGQCQVKILLSGNGVSDSFLEPCSTNDVDLISDNVLIFGNPKKNNFCFYSKEPNTLVVIKNKVCTKRVYSVVKGLNTSKKAPMTIAKCTEIKRIIANEMERRKDKKPIKMNPPAPSTNQQTSPSTQTTVLQPAENLINRPTYSLHTKWSYEGKCQRDIEVLGKGINDRFLASCPENEIPFTISNDKILLLTDLVGDLELFSDAWATLIVIQNGECTKRTYNTTNGKTEITPTSMTEDECTEVKEKMSEYV